MTTGRDGLSGSLAGFRSPAGASRPGPAINPLFADMPRYIGRQDRELGCDVVRSRNGPGLALKNGGFIEASDPDLAKFKARGGKLLFYHGWADPGPAPENTIDYYRRERRAGGKQDDWMRLFLMPGVGHCGGGVGTGPGGLPRRDRTVARIGIAPAQIPRHPSCRTAANDAAVVSVSAGGRYSGTGSTDEAQNFVCSAP